MKYKHIMTFFGIALPVCVLIRTLQVFFTIDEKGFIRQSYKSISFKMTVLLCAATIVTVIIGALTHRCPTSMPRVTLPLGICSIALGVWTIYDIVHISFSAAVPMWQIVLSDLSGFLCGLLFIIYGAKAFFRFELPKLFFTVPVLFWIIRLICVFTTLSTLALTTGHIFLLAADCAVLVFMLEFAKQINGLDEEYNFKKMLASGMCAVLLCAVSTIPYLLAMLAGKTVLLNESISSLILMLLTGIFIAVFALAHFSTHNLKARKHRHSKTNFMQSDGKDNFYTGYTRS